MVATVTEYQKTGGKPSTPLFPVEINVLCDDSYPAGGWPLSLADFLPNSAAIVGTFVDDHIELTGYRFDYDRANDKLKVYECKGAVGAMTELATANALDGKNIRLIVLCY
jgi:hypothetical protein